MSGDQRPAQPRGQKVWTTVMIGCSVVARVFRQSAYGRSTMFRAGATRPSTKIVYKALACTNAEDDIPDGRPRTSQVPCHRGPLAQWQS
jgi:hypothetical protein